VIGVCLLLLGLGATAAGAVTTAPAPPEVLPAASSAADLWIVRPDTSAKVMTIYLWRAGENDGYLRLVKELTGHLAPGGVAAGRGWLWLVTDSGAVTSVRPSESHPPAPVAYESVNEAALPAGMTLRSLAAGREDGCWALVRAEDTAAPTTAAATQPDPAASAPASQPAAGTASAPAPRAGDRLLHYDGSAWAQVPLPDSWPDGAPAWLVLRAEDDKFPMLLTVPAAIDRPGSQEALWLYEHAPAEDPAASQPVPAAGPGAQSQPRPGSARSSLPISNPWRRVGVFALPGAAEAHVTAVLGQVVVGVPMASPAGTVTVDLAILRPDLDRPMALPALHLNDTAAGSPWAVAAAGPGVALLAWDLTRQVLWARQDLMGRPIGKPDRLTEKEPGLYHLPVSVVICVAALVVAVLIMFIYWRRDAAADHRLTLPPELALADPVSRALAGLIDAAPCVALTLWLFSITQPLDLLNGWVYQGGDWPEWYPRLFLAGLLVVYTTAAELFTARTLGKAVFGLRVTDLAGKPPDAWQVLGRNLVRGLELLMPLLLVLPLISTWRQRLGDLIARTVVTGPAKSSDPSEDESDDDES
jgi:uncharacterized RDD family membrane protein YckC